MRVEALSVRDLLRKDVLVRVGSGETGHLEPVGQKLVPVVEVGGMNSQEAQEREVRLELVIGVEEVRENSRNVLERRQAEIGLPDFRVNVRMEVVDFDGVGIDRLDPADALALGVR